MKQRNMKHSAWILILGMAFMPMAHATLTPQERAAAYGVLNVAPNASKNDIRNAYLKLAKQFHPDKNPEGRNQFDAIKNAYEALTSDDALPPETSKQKYSWDSTTPSTPAPQVARPQPTKRKEAPIPAPKRAKYSSEYSNTHIPERFSTAPEQPAPKRQTRATSTRSKPSTSQFTDTKNEAIIRLNNVDHVLVDRVGTWGFPSMTDKMLPASPQDQEARLKTTPVLLHDNEIIRVFEELLMAGIFFHDIKEFLQPYKKNMGYTTDAKNTVMIEVISQLTTAFHNVAGKNIDPQLDKTVEALCNDNDISQEEYSKFFQPEYANALHRRLKQCSQQVARFASKDADEPKKQAYYLNQLIGINAALKKIEKIPAE